MKNISSLQSKSATERTEAEILQALRDGSMAIEGLLPHSSNYSFLVTLNIQDEQLSAVYKPQRGESPLWDFETGTLCAREVAAYVTNNALGWHLIPPTILRDGEYGIGSVQFYIEHDVNEHYFTFQEDARFTDSLRRLALFDFVVNNADRKSGHCLAGCTLKGDTQCLWAIDHGICFHTEYKLRTVIWEFSNEAIAPELLSDLNILKCEILSQKSPLHQHLAHLLSNEERIALLTRIDQLLSSQIYPAPISFTRNYPWPPV
ncbi:SCO1664 family protein [Chloroflexi bacterium TSY]|nr:SCO1664 family protein [Chloroflexi bacterium TSY]